jgi:hypothetical protein
LYVLDRSEIREETFGILTDDNLALEATLVRPAGLDDEAVEAVQVWVPKYPLTRSSLLPAARTSTMAAGGDRAVVNLTYDPRGAGESDGVPSKDGFEIDLHSIEEWARERFGVDVELSVFGFADLGKADRLITMPLREGVFMELYRYNPGAEERGTILYFSRYTHFGRDDDDLCRAVADAGYLVYGGDLMRYLLMAGPEVAVDTLLHDLGVMVHYMGRPLFLVARALAAGPTLLLAAANKAIDGVIVTGPAQEGLTPAHLFSRERPSQLVLLRHARDYSPRPGVFLWNAAAAGKLDPQGLKAFHDAMEGPRLWGLVPRIDPALLLNALRWLAGQGGEG